MSDFVFLDMSSEILTGVSVETEKEEEGEVMGVPERFETLSSNL